jgi:recombination protein RecR
MSIFEGALGRMIDELGRLPGVGPKTAQRLAFFLLRQERAEVENLAQALVQAKDLVRYCSRCFSLCEGEVCEICRDSRRNQTLLCVVEEPKDVFALERSREYRGLYHVLLGTLSPMEGIGPDQLKIGELLRRLQSGDVQEVIIATNPDVEGEATALYLHKLLKPLGLRVTRLASGLPAGGDLEYADDVTISRALGGRREIAP